MKIAIVSIKGVSGLSFSKHHTTPMLDRELADAYDQRTWRERLHYNKEGECYIPPMAFKNCLSEAAAFLGLQIKGKGKSTYRKHFESGIMVNEPAMLGIHKDKVLSETLFVPADGKRGSGKRVWRTFPLIQEGWTASFNVYILDEIVAKDIFRTHVEAAGKFIGLGRFRPANNGFYGRFGIVKIEWRDGSEF